MASKFHQSFFHPNNPKKYVGKGSIKMRSSWETTFAMFCDNDPNVLEWASESIRIPYFNPLTRKKTTYVPDFLVRYKDARGKEVVELVEIKPYKQSVFEGRQNQKQKEVVAVNHAKWKAAQMFCKAKGIQFRVVTEKELYRK
ncbi:MAG: hypothetical protein DRQ47_07535 [Gammaproteobacteria bacterium]|nr:MAG: hypothetical protein DRQ47_07535 [Gammaproteobacteria bacterium]